MMSLLPQTADKHVNNTGISTINKQLSIYRPCKQVILQPRENSRNDNKWQNSI